MDLNRFQELQFDIFDWSNKTFGNGERTINITRHLKKEIDELLVALTSYYMGVHSNSISSDDGNVLLEKVHYRVRMELADCFILLMDIAAHAEIDTETILKDSMEKMKINKNRKWGTPDANGVVEHIKE
jgi:NTP pyrophosphatase (non-canonical NTP hydrolase)